MVSIDTFLINFDILSYASKVVMVPCLLIMKDWRAGGLSAEN